MCVQVVQFICVGSIPWAGRGPTSLLGVGDAQLP
jgi:hypothetical protein